MHKTRSIYDYHFEECMKDLLADSSGHFPNQKTVGSLNQYLTWDDWKVLGKLSDGQGGVHGEIMRNRNHYRLVYETEEGFDGPAEQDRATTIFNKIEAATKSMGCVRRFSNRNWYGKNMKSDILVRPSDGGSSSGIPLSRISAVVKSLRDVNQSRLYVPMSCVDSAVTERDKILVKGGNRGKN
jgi:uncharacterized protein